MNVFQRTGCAPYGRAKFNFSSNSIVILVMLDDEFPSKTPTYNVGDVLAITISPDDHLQYYYNKRRYELFVEYYNKRIFNTLKATLYDWYFSVELSEPIGKNINTKGPRLHLHGILKLKKRLSVFKYLLEVFPQMLIDSNMTIKHIKSSDACKSWFNYIEKQEKYMPQYNFTNFTNREFIQQLFPDVPVGDGDRSSSLVPGNEKSAAGSFVEFSAERDCIDLDTDSPSET